MKLSRKLSISLLAGLILGFAGIGAIAPDTPSNQRRILWFPKFSTI